ncbi:ATP-grasp domain-containing protein [Streptomyces muensis]|uniref:ATP-grasp domain-containing protein n=1 Tax=Streptomyces muensis TaxID=1077944 RepID=A0A9X1PZX3_STRM4|nr:ATP-grasp domain-containing protein [Streptomyces muensis]MCF1596026.1 ATP-grasp domain-containing protein [Streptomyces muensis]
MSSGTGQWFALLESNTTGTGREFCGAARARGLRPVLLTRDPDRYPYVAEDAVDTRVLDTGDLAAVVATCGSLAEDAGLAGITSSSEYFVADAARAAAKLGLPGPDGDAIARCRDKAMQRAALAGAGVPVPAWRAVFDVTEAVEAATAIGHPVVLKPVSGSGSLGVRLCGDRAETEEWARHLLGRGTDERGNTVPSRVLVEAVVDGPEFSVETFDNRVVTVVAKHTGPPPHFVETGHDIPAPVPPKTAAVLGDTALSALKALGLGWGAAHTELRWSAQGPVVIEVNPRLAGGMIPVAVRAVTGTDLVDAVVARAAGQDTAPASGGDGRGDGRLGTGSAGPAPAGERHAAVRFVMAADAGRVTSIHGLAAARGAPGVVAATAGTAVGRLVRITHSFQDRLACAVATGADTGQAGARADFAARLITIDLEKPAEPEEGNGGR